MKLGQTVIVHNAVESNGSSTHPGIVNRVWSDEMVNVMVLPDCGTPVCRTSVPHKDVAASGSACFELMESDPVPETVTIPPSPPAEEEHL